MPESTIESVYTRRCSRGWSKPQALKIDDKGTNLGKVITSEGEEIQVQILVRCSCIQDSSPKAHMKPEGSYHRLNLTNNF